MTGEPMYTTSEIVPRTSAISIIEVSITLHCQLCSTCYTALRIKSCLKSTMHIPKERNGAASPSYINYRGEHVVGTVVCQDTSQAEVTLNSEKIKPVALAVIELPLSESISQLLTLSSRKFR